MKQRTQAEASQRMAEVARATGADRTDVKKLIEVAGLDPASDFRFENWSGVDFSGVDLAGFDFTGARLHGCDFSGARISGARFDQAELGRVIHHPGRDPHAPAEITPIADLRKAADWVAYAKSWKASSPTSDAHLPVGAIFQDAPFAPELVVVPAGEFTMGSNEVYGPGQTHRATITSPFAVGRFTVRQTEWSKICSTRDLNESWAAADSKLAKLSSSLNITWNGARDYCARLSAVTGKQYRLLSEAEWEYSCRADLPSSFWADIDTSKEHAKFERRSEKLFGIRGKKRLRAPTDHNREQNRWGLFPTRSGILEWCEDRFHEHVDGIPTDNSAWMSGRMNERVVRGGSHKTHPDILRSHFRFGLEPDLLQEGVGFRVVRVLSTS